MHASAHDHAAASGSPARTATGTDMSIPADLFGSSPQQRSLQVVEPAVDPCVAAALSFAASRETSSARYRAVRAEGTARLTTTPHTPAVPVGPAALPPCTEPAFPTTELDAALAFAAARANAAAARAAQANAQAYAHLTARALLLRRVGRYSEAQLVTASAGPPPTPHVPIVATGEARSLRPQPTAAAPRAPNRIAIGAPQRDASTMLAWQQASIVAASNMLPPANGTELTPVQIAVQGVHGLPPGARRARIAALAAAARLVPFMSLTQVSKVLGCPESYLKERDIALVAADVKSSRWRG